MTLLTRPVSENRAQRLTGGADIPSTFAEGLGAAFGFDTIGDLLGRQGEIAAAERGGFGADRRRSRTGRETPQGPDKERIAPERLNEMFSDYGVTFDAPMTERGARLIAEARRSQRLRDDVLARAPGGLATVGYFGAGLAAMATDPFEVASALVPVVGPGRLAMLTARLGRVGGRAAAGVIEGAVGNALVEPIYYGLSRQQQLDYGMADALMNIALGAGFGGAIGTASGVIARRADARARQDIARDVEAIRADVEQVVSAPEIRAHRSAVDTAVDALSRGEAYNMTRAEMRTLERATGGNMPVLRWLRDQGGIDPDGAAAAELRAIGVTPRTMPGLFRRGGMKDIDNLSLEDSDEWITEGLIRKEADADGGATYLSRESIFDAVREEMAGRPIRTEAQRDAARRISEADFGPAEHEISMAAERLGVRLSDTEFTQAAARLMAQGEDADDVVMDIAMRSMDAPVDADPRGDMPFFDDDDAASRMVDRFTASRSGDDLADDEAFWSAAVDDLRRSGDLSDMDAAMVAEADAFVIKAEAAGDVSRAYAACLGR